MDINTLKRIYDLTGKNVFFELDDPKNSDPLVWKALIWEYRKIKDNEAKLEDVKELGIEEMVEAYKYFFRC